MDTITETHNRLSPSRLPSVQHLVEKINEKIKKLGIEGEASMEFEVYKTTHDDKGNPCFGYDVMTVRVNYPKLVLSGDIKVLACVESQGEFNLVTSFDGVPRDKEYLKASMSCDHCNQNRRRKSVYLVKHKGAIKQVGKSCFNEYVGMNSGLNKIYSYRKFVDEMDELWGSLYQRTPSHYGIEDVVRAVVPSMGPNNDKVWEGAWQTLENRKGCRPVASKNHTLVTGVMADLNEFADKLKAGEELDDFQTKVAVMTIAGVPTDRGSHMKACIGMVRWFVGKLGDKLEQDVKAERFKGLPSSQYVCSEGDAIKVGAVILKGWTQWQDGFSYHDSGQWNAKMYLRDVNTGNIFFTQVSASKAKERGWAKRPEIDESQVGVTIGFSRFEDDDECLEFTEDVIELVATVSGHFTNKSGEKVTKLNRVRNVPTTKASLKKIKEQEVV